MPYENLNLTELRDLFWKVKLLQNMHVQRAKAYSRALDPLIERYGQYRTEWLTTADFVQIIEEAKTSSQNYPLRRMGALRYFFAFLHELRLLTYEELTTLQNASYDRR